MLILSDNDDRLAAIREKHERTWFVDPPDNAQQSSHWQAMQFLLDRLDRLAAEVARLKEARYGQEG